MSFFTGQKETKDRRMDELLANLIVANNKSSNFIGGRTAVSGPPVTTSSRIHGPMVLSLEPPPVGTSFQHQPGASYSRSQVLTTHNSSNNVVSSSPAFSSSILKTDMTPMIAWLTSQTSSVADSQAFSAGATLNSQAYEAYTSEDYRKSIPKPYIELTERDSASVVAQAIGSIVLHTCNDEFRQQCLSKLEASNSREVDREIKSRLNAIIDAQEEQQNQSDGENQEMDQSSDMNNSIQQQDCTNA